ncbi:MAG: universal stress protein [Deltaproteobacteria bacterium]|nr:universal stress protein [Deltaproteobacteria bacterium]
MFAEILALYDFSPPSKIALEWALRLGQHFHSSLRVLQVFSRPSTVSKNDFLKYQAEILQQIREQIDQDVRQIFSHSSKELKSLEIEVKPGKATSVILNEIQSTLPDLVVIGTHGRTGLSHLLLGSVAEKVLRHSPSPVWVVRSPSAWPPKSVLLPIDESEPVEETFDFLTRLSSSLFLQAHALYVLPFPIITPAYVEGLVLMNPATLEKESLESLTRIINQHPSSPKITPHVSTGLAVTEICHLAKEVRADLILIPTHGRSGLNYLFMGSVAGQVVRYAPCSVLSFCPQQGFAYRKKLLEEMMEEEDLSYQELGVGD